jgi:hypothetical protein
MISARELLAHPARLIAVATLVVPLIGATPPPPRGPLAERVVFASADGHTSLADQMSPFGSIQMVLNVSRKPRQFVSGPIAAKGK